MKRLSTQTLLKAYSNGLFPMSDSADAPDIYWVEPVLRGILPLDALKVSTSLKKKFRNGYWDITVNHRFEDVLEACAMPKFKRENTWINSTIKKLYTKLHEEGHAHSVEVSLEGELVGGLYGVSLGGAFFGESMFHTVTDASKIALIHLVARLKAGGYSLLDTQFVTNHLISLGAIEVRQSEYLYLLKEALKLQGNFNALDVTLTPQEILEILK